MHKENQPPRTITESAALRLLGLPATAKWRKCLRHNFKPSEISGTYHYNEWMVRNVATTGGPMFGLMNQEARLASANKKVNRSRRNIQTR